MTSLATAFVDIRPDMTGFRSKLSADVSRSATTAGREGGGHFSKSFKGAIAGVGAALAGVFAVSQGVSFFKGAIEEARDAQKVGAQTAAVLKSTRGEAGLTAKAIGDLATRISNKTAIDDEAIQSGENLLLTFTNIRDEAGKGNDIFSQTTQIMTDLSAATGQSMKSSAIQLGKALNDPVKGVTALQRVGVSFNDTQKTTIDRMVKTGDTMGAQKLILHELNKEFAGSAKAQATPAERAEVAWGNFKEAIGTAVLPMLDRLLTWFTDKGLPAVQNFVDWMRRHVVPALRNISDFVSDTVVPALGDFKDAIQDKILDPLSDIGKRISDKFENVDITGVARNLADQAKSWAGPVIAGFGQGLNTGDWSGLGEAVGTGLIRAIGALADLAGKIGGILGDLLAKVDWVGIGIAMGKQAPSLLVGVAAGLLNFDLLGLLKGLADHWQEVLLAILAIAFTPGRVIGKIGEILARIPFVGRLLEWLLSQSKTLADGIWKFVLDRFIKPLGDGFINGFRSIFPKIGSGFADELRILPTKIGLARLWVMEKAGQMMEGLAGAIGKAFHFVGDIIGKVIGWIIKPWAKAGTWLLQAGKDILTGAWNGLKAMVSPITGWLGKLLGPSGPIRSAFSKAVDAIGTIWDGLKAMARKPVEFVVNVVFAGLVKAINKIPGISLPVPHFAKGGEVPLWAGERGKDSVLSMLMPGEHVWTEDEVNKVGGHRNMKRIRNAIKNGYLSIADLGGKIPAFASGGGLPDDRVQAAARFATSQQGKPYIWGGVGPAGYDCSGFMSAITNVLRGRYPYARVGATASFPWAGFAPGSGEFTIGSTPNYGGSGVGHMAGTLKGMNVESRGGLGVVTGSAARGWNDGGFSTHAHLGAAGDYSGPGTIDPLAPFKAAIGAIKGLVSKIGGWFSELANMGGWGGLVKDAARAAVTHAREWVNDKVPGPGPFPSFDRGGRAHGLGVMHKATIRPERVLSPRQTEAFERLVDRLENGGGGMTVNVQEINTRDDELAMRKLRGEMQKAVTLAGLA